MPKPLADPPGNDAIAERGAAEAAALDDVLGGFAEPGHGGDAAGTMDAADPRVAGLIDTMLLLRQIAAADGVAPAAAAGPVPRAIGRHAIIRLAGEGGFATVWEGFDTLLRRPVAVKVLRPEALLSATARRRFVREAEIAARLVHPHVVTIFEVGTAEGREFIAAEFCPGGSLAAWLERHPDPLPPRAAARLGRALAGAVAYAHEAGVVHRDIKPANVLLAPAPAGTDPILHEPAAAGRGVTVKLGDFGLGKLQEDVDSGDPLTQLTRTGASIGTPAWMAPEQIDRSFGAVGPATDVHALGLLLDRLLTGRALRSGGTTAETYRQVLIDDAPPADRVVRGVPRDLAAVCLKCLAKRPADRYASAAALAADLDRWLDGRPTEARPISPGTRALRWVTRRPVVAALGTATILATLAAAWAGITRISDVRNAVARDAEIRGQRAVAELRRGFESLRAGNVGEALAHLGTARDLDATLADSLAGRWLLRRAHGERAILLEPGPTAAATNRPRDLYAITLAPGGTTAAVAAADGSVHLLRGLDGTPTIDSVAAHDEVNDAAFSADGTRLVTAGQDGRLRWWDITAAGLVAAGAVDPAAGPLFAAAFAPDGHAIACGGADRVVRLVRLDEPDRTIELYRFPEPPGQSPEVESLVFTRAGTIAAACGDQIAIIDATSGGLVRECERPFAGHRNAVLGSLEVSPDGRRLLACGTNARAHLWDLDTGKIVLSLPMHPAWVQGCCFVGGGDRLATACRDGCIRVFDTSSGAIRARLVGHVGRVWGVACEPAGTLLSCGADGTVRRWNPDDDFETAALRHVNVEGAEITHVAEIARSTTDPGARDLVALDAGHQLSRIDVAQGSSWPLARVEDGHGFDFDVEGAGRRLVATWSERRTVKVRDLATPEAGLVDDAPAAADWRPIDLPPAFDPAHARARWLPDGGMIVSTKSGSACVLPPTLTKATVIDAPLRDPVHGLAVAPAGPTRVAAIGSVSAILDLRSGAVAGPSGVIVLPVGEQTTAVGWSPDATRVAYGTDTGRVVIFDAATGAARGQLAPLERLITGVAFSTDGRILVTADPDSVRICDAETLSTLDEFRPGWTIRALRLAAGGSRLVLAGRAGAEPGPGAARLAVMEFEAR